jgi:uncharacterized protein YjiS (DUF1127 family)
LEAGKPLSSGSTPEAADIAHAKQLKEDLAMRSEFTETAGGFWPAGVRADAAPGEGGTGIAADFNRPGIVERSIGMLRLWRTRARARAADRRMLAELATLDEHTLRDIGINWAHLHRQASKPFWRA